MHKLLGLVVLGLACTLGLRTLGCKKAEEKGKGGEGGKGGNGGGGVTIIKYTFPTEVIILKPGEKKEVAIKREGKEKDLKEQPVEVTSPTKHVTVEEGKFEKEGKTATVTVHAAKDAKPGKHTIKVKADGQEGKIDVEVKGD